MANTATLKPFKPQPRTSAGNGAYSHPVACAYAMLSDRGQVRHINQDACAALAELGAFVVCDGIGGAAGGEVASHLAAEAFLHALSQPIVRPARRAAPKGEQGSETVHPPEHPQTRLRQAVCAANQAVFRHSRQSPALRGMGTTLVAAVWDDSVASLWLANVGDSRCYLFRRGVLRQLTTDHSLVEEQIRAGILSRAEAAGSPIRNIITRAVGSEPTVVADIVLHPTRPGDLYLLATDGLTRELEDEEIVRILSQAPSATLEATCRALIDAANASGGGDNITVLLIACP